MTHLNSPVNKMPLELRELEGMKHPHNFPEREVTKVKVQGCTSTGAESRTSHRTPLSGGAGIPSASSDQTEGWTVEILLRTHCPFSAAVLELADISLS